MIKYCAIALCALSAVLVLRGAKSEFADIVGTVASVLLFGAAAVSFAPIVEFVRETVSGTGFEGYLSTMFKSLGIALSAQLASELCRDHGQASLASKLELIGKAELMILCIPLMKELITLAAEMMDA